MESIYYVLCWHCHRRCKHCYEDRFRPYIRDELEAVVTEAIDNFPRIIANLPESMTFLEAVENPGAGQAPFIEKTGKIILSGGDVLTDPVRERVLYPVLEALRDKYKNTGGIKVVVQTTGDLLTPKIIGELLSLGVWSISVSGMDDFHVGMEGDKKKAIAQGITQMLEAAGVMQADPAADREERALEEGPIFSMFGANEDTWIGKLWPRGRAWKNGLSHATLDDNFCNAWSGGLNFLQHGYAGSEVSIDPTGDVYPCCIKTAHPLGNLVEEPLLEILDSLAGIPAIEAINAGQPERMGLSHDWNEEKFIEASKTTTPKGESYANLCIGCDRFHEEVLGSVLDDKRRERRAQRLGVLASNG
ncbi:MAG: hypothetical protein COA96_11695 [SAR86 cluster bacterium]|uniref:4Fe4S-binding SPASM domain-containing protein n=1 Tax=SAR86 cluster bacterium TaxID=2030880 RepID=A0A2A5AW89_9GAMM|nr:MAG: hypothetical protein COA96_11695 [SAR86 cluster bacterium]